MKYRLTRESARVAGAFYEDAKLAEMIPPEGLTPKQVADLDLPMDDRHWMLVFAMGAEATTLRLHAVWCARRALGGNPNARSMAALDMAERFALGEAKAEELELVLHPVLEAAQNSRYQPTWVALAPSTLPTWAARWAAKWNILDSAKRKHMFDSASRNTKHTSAWETVVALLDAEQAVHVQDLASRLEQFEL